MKIRWDINLKWVLLLFVQLNRSINYQKMDDKDIADAIKLVKELIWYLLVQSTNRCFCENYVQIEKKKPIDGSTNEKKS